MIQWMLKSKVFNERTKDPIRLQHTFEDKIIISNCLNIYLITQGGLHISDIMPDAELDCLGLYCPMPIARTKEEIEKIEVGQVLKVEADDPGAEEDIIRWAKRAGQQVLKFEKSGSTMTFWIKRIK